MSKNTMRQHRQIDSGYKGRDSLNRVRSRASPAGVADENVDIIAAIDIGTTYMGYAFGLLKDLEEDKRTIYLNNSWISGNYRLTTLKAPTAVLFTPEKRFHSLGYEAERKYSLLAADKVNGGWYYFRRFKMTVLQDEGLSPASSIQDDTGKPMRTAMVFGAVIKSLKTHLLDNLAVDMKTTAQWLMENFVFRWVLTYPTTWGDSAKEFLKLSAKQASIAEVLLIPEPEAAAMYCQVANLHRINTRNGEIICIQKQNLQYLVLDLGGGTVDTTIHEFNSSNKIKEMHSTCGTVFGGLRVDGAFVEFLMKVVGFDVMDNFAQKFRSDLLQLHKEFEWKKRTFDPISSESIAIKLPVVLRKMYEVNTHQTLHYKVNNSEYGDLVKMVGDSIHIDPEIFKGFFITAGDQIVTHLMKVLSSKAGRSVKTIVMVGGFATSQCIQSLIRRKFPDMTILMPDSPEVAVMKGAVLYGYEFAPIVFMKAKFTYGISMAMPFNQADHLNEKKFEASNISLCADLFCRHIIQGDTVRIGDFVSNSKLYINRKNQKYLSIPVFLSVTDSALYTTDGMCHYLGKVKITLQADRDDKAPITVKMGLTYTELLVEVTDESNGRVVRDTFLDSPPGSSDR